MAEIQFLEAAIGDLRELDGSLLVPVLRKIMLLEASPEAGRPLGRARRGDLTTFRKLVVGNRDIRVVYRVEPDGRICVVWVIPARADDQCYDLAIRRLRDLGDTRATPLADVLSGLRPSARRGISPPGT